MNETRMSQETDFNPGFLRQHRWAMVDVFKLGEDWTSPWPTQPLVPLGHEDDAALFPALLDIKNLYAEHGTQRALGLNSLHTWPPGQLYEQLYAQHQAGQELTLQMLFNCAADDNTLGRHWLSHLVLPTSGGEGGAGEAKALLRSYSPKVFLQLRRILTGPQLKNLYGPITDWAMHVQGGWLRFAAPDAGADDCSQMSLEQASQIARIGDINEVLTRLPQPATVLPANTPPLTPKAVPAYAHQASEYDALSQQIDGLVQQASTQGWSRDAVLFAVLGVLLTETWYLHPRMTQLLANANPDEQTLRDVLVQLTPQDWAEVAR
jgi:hypothetical protein